VRISLTEPVHRPAEVFSLAVAFAVLSTSGGDWVDGGAPVDRQALCDLLDSLDRSRGLTVNGDPGAPTGDPEDTFTLSGGTIRWDRRRIEVQVEDVDFMAHITAELRSEDGAAGPGETIASVHVRGRPRRRLHRVAAFLGGPVIRGYLRREVKKQSGALAQQIASMPTVPEVAHRSDEWRFVPDRGATRSAMFR